MQVETYEAPEVANEPLEASEEAIGSALVLAERFESYARDTLGVTARSRCDL